MVLSSKPRLEKSEAMQLVFAVGAVLPSSSITSWCLRHACAPLSSNTYATVWYPHVQQIPAALGDESDLLQRPQIVATLSQASYRAMSGSVQDSTRTLCEESTGHHKRAPLEVQLSSKGTELHKVTIRNRGCVDREVSRCPWLSGHASSTHGLQKDGRAVQFSKSADFITNPGCI